MEVKKETRCSVSSLLNPGGGPNPVNSLFFSLRWQAHIKPVKAPPLKPAARQAVPVQCVSSLHIHIQDLHTRAQLEISENSAVDILLGILFIERGISGIFLT